MAAPRQAAGIAREDTAHEERRPRIRAVSHAAQSAYPLNDEVRPSSTPLPETVTFCVCAPYFSCQASIDVVARRQILDLEGALVVGHREEGVVEDAAVGAHPLVHVALEADRHLGLVELLQRLHLLEGLADVELGVVLRQRVDVVERPVAVEDLQRLAGLDPEDVRAVLAAVLVERDRRPSAADRCR